MTPIFDRDKPPFSGMLKQLKHDALRVVRTEIESAKGDLDSHLRGMAAELALVAVGAGLALVAAVMLAIAASSALGVLLGRWMAESIAGWLAPLLIGVGLAAAALVVLAKGRRRLASGHRDRSEPADAAESPGAGRDQAIDRR